VRLGIAQKSGSFIKPVAEPVHPTLPVCVAHRECVLRFDQRLAVLLEVSVQCCLNGGHRLLQLTVGIALQLFSQTRERLLDAVHHSSEDPCGRNAVYGNDVVNLFDDLALPEKQSPPDTLKSDTFLLADDDLPLVEPDA